MGDEYNIDHMMRKFVEIYEADGLEINYRKTKNLLNIEKSEENRYLGSLMTLEGKSKMEIINRIEQA